MSYRSAGAAPGAILMSDLQAGRTVDPTLGSGIGTPTATDRPEGNLRSPHRFPAPPDAPAAAGSKNLLLYLALGGAALIGVILVVKRR